MKTENQKQDTEEVYLNQLIDEANKEFSLDRKLAKKVALKFAKWQQEQEQNNENSWFNEYQEVEDYIIKRIGDKFLEATPEKYNTASEATIALLENNWQQERMYSEEEVHAIIESYQNNVENNPNHITYDKWFEKLKKK